MTSRLKTRTIDPADLDPNKKSSATCKPLAFSISTRLHIHTFPAPTACTTFESHRTLVYTTTSNSSRFIMPVDGKLCRSLTDRVFLLITICVIFSRPRLPLVYADSRSEYLGAPCVPIPLLRQRRFSRLSRLKGEVCIFR